MLTVQLDSAASKAPSIPALNLINPPTLAQENPPSKNELAEVGNCGAISHFCDESGKFVNYIVNTIFCCGWHSNSEANHVPECVYLGCLILTCCNGPI